MDNIISVCQREKIDSSEIILYPEGIFYKVYGYSAFRFTRHIRPYRVKKHYYKKLGDKICSVGFPQSALSQLLGKDWQMETSDDMLVIRGEFDPIDPAEFETWMEAVPLNVPKPRGPSSEEKKPEGIAEGTMANPLKLVNAAPQSEYTTREEVLCRLHGFALESATPLECMIFLSELKKRLNG